MIKFSAHTGRSITLAIVIWGLINVIVLSAAGERSSDDIGHDLTESLVAKGRLDEAEGVCRFELENLTEGQLPYAKWTSRLSMVLAERHSQGMFGGRTADLDARIDPAVNGSISGIDVLLASYPESAAAEFLAATKLTVRQRILTSAIIAASVSPPDQTLIDGLISRISRLQLDTSELHDVAQAKWSARSTRSAQPDRGEMMISAEQYSRLIQELSVQRISLAVLQTELFTKGSDDYRAAATDAAVIAQDRILALPDGTPAKRSARALLVEALLRSGGTDEAGELIQTVCADPEANAMPTWIALKVRYALANRQDDLAKSICDDFYGSDPDPDSLPRSIEMDFAKLDVLLKDSESESELAKWLDFIQRRGGAFARRRAESIAIGLLRNRPVSDDQPGKRPINPALIAAQGEDWLRRNDPRQAATLLREAALAEPQPKIAFQYAAKAAAAIAKSDTTAAIDVLRQTARTHAKDSSASDLMIQAALLASKPFQPTDNPQTRLALLEDLLNELTQTWPGGDAARKANAWVCRIYQQTDRIEEAARAALELLTLGMDPQQVAPTAEFWFDYVSRLETSKATEELTSLTATLRELADQQQSLLQPISREAIWLLDRSFIDDHRPTIQDSDPLGLFLNQLASFRTNQSGSISTDGVDPSVLSKARWRLERDAMLDQSVQHAVGVALGTWPNQTPWETATADLWNDPDEESISTIRNLSISGKERSTSLRRGMNLLATAASQDAKRAAIDLSDRLAATMTIGSDPWYSIKLQSLTWLQDVGDNKEASKRAQYILLLHPPSDEPLRKQFNGFVSR